MKCTNPELCIHYYEIINPYNSAKNPKAICIKHDFDINYNNLDKIENCECHKTYYRLIEERKIN